MRPARSVHLPLKSLCLSFFYLSTYNIFRIKRIVNNKVQNLAQKSLNNICRFLQKVLDELFDMVYTVFREEKEMKNKDIVSAKIISGEGEVGTVEQFTGTLSIRAISMRLRKEIGKGD